MNNVFYYESPYLAHHGVLGQKWGVRRYQNADGSLTNYGRKQQLKNIEKDRSSELRTIRKNTKWYSNNRTKKISEANLKYDNQRIKSARNEKEKFKEYKKALNRGGMPGSFADFSNNSSSTKLVKQMKTQEGEAYTNKVLDSYKNQLIASMVGTVAVAVGIEALNLYINSR